MRRLWLGVVVEVEREGWKMREVVVEGGKMGEPVGVKMEEVVEMKNEEEEVP